MIIHLIIGFLLMAISVIIVGIAAATENVKSYLKTLFCWITLTIGIMLLSFYNDKQPIRSDKPFITNTEIKVEVVNDVEISRDTTYILIRPNATITGAEHKLKSK